MLSIPGSINECINSSSSLIHVQARQPCQQLCHFGLALPFELIDYHLGENNHLQYWVDSKSVRDLSKSLSRHCRSHLTSALGPRCDATSPPLHRPNPAIERV